MATVDPAALTFPPPEFAALPTCNPRPLLPLQPPPSQRINSPTLASVPRASLLDTRFVLTTHIVPAAFPRTTPVVPLPDLPQWSPDKNVFKASVQRTTDAILDTKEKQWRGELDGLPRDKRPWWNCVNRYVRKGLREARGKSGGVTLFCTHANGFTKEIWEPMLERLVNQFSSESGYEVDEIWSWEAANHGDSCLINKDVLGGIYDWRDNSRGILHFLQFYLPSHPSPDPLPTHLPRLTAEEGAARREHGIQDRTLVFIGHSFGGCSLARAALDEPELFRSLFLVDAIIYPLQPSAPRANDWVRGLVTGAVRRRDGWASREEAHKQFAATPFFQAWDPAALAVYVACALYDAPDGTVKLKMPGIQEAVCFTETFAPSETFELLPKLDPRIETRWIVAGKLNAEDTESRRRTVWRRTVNSSHVRVLSSGHLIVQETPSKLAKELHKFLSRLVGGRKALL